MIVLVIQISAVILLAVSIISLYSLLKSRLVTGKLTIGGMIDPTDLVLSDPNVRVWHPTTNILNGTVTQGEEVIECYRCLTSSHWFRYDNHAALPTMVSNLLNREARRLEQSNCYLSRG